MQIKQNMKTLKPLIILFACMFTATAAFAQTDIKSLNEAGLQKVKNQLGSACANCSWAFYDDFYLLEEKPGRAASPEITLWEDSYSLRSFATDSPKYIFLSDYISGGVKVGDPLSKVKDINFAGTTYGRNDTRNNCRKVNFYDGNEWYVIFGQTHQEIELRVENGVIKEIRLDWPDREEGFFPDNYDITNCMF